MTGRPDALARSAATPIQDRLRAARLPPLGLSAWVEVDLDALEANARLLRRLVPRQGLLGIVVKANGYGHGLEMAARAATTGGADWLVVATLDEAAVLRASGVRLPILAIYPVPRESLETAAALHLDVVVGSTDTIEAVVAVAGAIGGSPGSGSLRVHLEVDTGMTRGGALPSEAPAAARRLAATPGLHVAGVWSHLRSPDDPAASAAQVARFQATTSAIAAAGVPVRLRHMVASDGLLGGTCPFFDLARIGYAFYGGTDTAPAPSDEAATVTAALRPALAVKAQAVRLAEVPVATEVGYGGTWRAERPSVIATLPIGYADGWARSSSPGTWAIVRDRRVPLVGRVSMDAVAVDVTDAGPVGPADEFVLVGGQGTDSIPAGEPAAVRGTITREVLASIGPRLPRVYVRGDGRPVAVTIFQGGRVVEPAAG